MKVIKRQKVTRIENITIAHQCDVCKKQVEGHLTPEGWHKFTSSHGDWGNDSIDSYQDHEVCSADCFGVAIKELLDANGHRRSFEIDNMSVSFLQSLCEKLNK